MPKLDRRQQLIAFFSADMANATEFKSRHQAHHVEGVLLPARWPRYFSEVFNQILQQFDEELRRRDFSNAAIPYTKPRLWKINGDELLFRELVSPGEDGAKWMAVVVSAFADTIRKIDGDTLPDGLGLRGCVWTAGFPIRNKEIRVPTGHVVPTIRADGDDALLPDFETGMIFPEQEGLVDYLGPDMDLGFRLAALTPPGRTTCSLDVGHFLVQQSTAPNIHHIGWRTMKGVGGGAPYPVLWLESGDDKHPRHPWDDVERGELKRFLESRPLRRSEFTELAETYWKQLSDYFQRPYTSPDEITSEHRRIWKIIADSDSADFNPIILDEYSQY
jgi:hypothetical protein